MYPMHNLARPLRDFAITRLEGLHLALHQLAGRLRDSIATVIGTHVDNAIGDAVRAALERRLPDEDEDPDEFYDERSPYSRHNYEDHRSQWHDPEPIDRWRDSGRNSPPTTFRSLPNWLPLVPPALHGLAWLLEPLLARWPWLAALGVGAAAALTATLLSPLAGVLAGSAGVAFVMLHLVDSARQGCGTARDLLGR